MSNLAKEARELSDVNLITELRFDAADWQQAIIKEALSRILYKLIMLKE